MEASGNVTINGIITANGAVTDDEHCGGGSGGGIYITCAGSFSGTSGLLWAIGGSVKDAPPQGGGGGGGRIAVWYGVADWRRARILAGNMARVVITNSYSGFSGAVSVTNGAGSLNPPDPGGAYPGTTIFLTVIEPPIGTLVGIH